MAKKKRVTKAEFVEMLDESHEGDVVETSEPDEPEVLPVALNPLLERDPGRM